MAEKLYDEFGEDTGTLRRVIPRPVSHWSRPLGQLKALLVDNTVPERHFQGKWAAVIESINPYEPFGYGEIVIHVLARSIKTGDDFATATAQYNKGFGRFHAPAAEWLFGLLRHIFSDQFPDDDAYELALTTPRLRAGLSLKTSETQGTPAKDAVGTATPSTISLMSVAPHGDPCMQVFSEALPSAPRQQSGSTAKLSVRSPAISGSGLRVA